MTHIAPDPNFAPDEAFAKALDAEDPLAAFRDRFEIPQQENGEAADDQHVKADTL